MRFLILRLRVLAVAAALVLLVTLGAFSAKAAGARCEAPGLLDFYVDPYLSGDCGVSTGDVIEYGGFSSINPVPGMLDYAYVITHGGKTEVVMYRQRRYDFKVRQ